MSQSPLVAAPCNVSARLRAFATSQADAIAIVESNGRSITFGALEADVERLARGLRAYGMKPGQRIALLVPPSIDSIALVFAMLRAGLVQILIDPGMGKRNLIDCLAEAEPQGFIAIRRGQIARALYRRRFPQAKLNVVVGRKLILGETTLDDIRRLGEAAPAFTGDDAFGTNADDPAAIIFTTGSTGPPKGVLYRHGNFDAQVELIRDQYGIRPGEIDVPCFPLFGLFNAAMGVTTVLPKMDFSRPASVAPREIIDHALVGSGATQSFASPAVWDKIGRVCEDRLKRAPGLDPVVFPKLKRVLSAGAPVTGPVLRRMVGCLPSDAELHTPYGATEALPVATISAREILNETWSQTERGAGVCVGRRFARIAWKVIKLVEGPIASLDDIEELPPGEVGELIVNGPTITTEYVTRRDANAKAKIADRDGGVWHRMGDLGYLDAQDRFWFCGRAAHRVWTVEGLLDTAPVEEIFNTHPEVRRTALVGCGRTRIQTPTLFVEPRDVARSWFGTRLPDVATQNRIESELLELGSRFPHLAGISDIRFHTGFPVDIRHNAKIFREKLAAEIIYQR